ncbi:MAG: hypothetical protein RXO29_05545 [Desulfurococcales archaeon]
MGLLESIEEKYRKIIASSSSEIKNYRSAGKRLKTAVLATLTSSISIIYYIVLFSGSSYLFAFSLIIPAVMFWLYVLDSLVKVSSSRKKAEEELYFIMVASASISKTGLELADALAFFSNSKIFEAANHLGKRFSRLSEMYGVAEALGILSKSVGGRLKLLMNEYIASLSSGTALYMLKDRANDIVKSEEDRAERSIQLRITLSLLITAVLGIAPSLISGIMALQSFAFLESQSEPQGNSAYLYSISIIALTPVLYAAIPDYPLSMKVTFSSNGKRVFSTFQIIGFASLILPTFLLLKYGSVGEFALVLFATSIISCALQAMLFQAVMKAMINGYVEKEVEDMLNHARIWRSLLLYKPERSKKIGEKVVKPWVESFLEELIEFFRRMGDCEPSSFQLFVDFIHEAQRSLKKVIHVLLVSIGTSLLSPVMSIMMLGLGGSVVPQQILIAYVSSLSYGFLAEKVALGTGRTALFPSLTALSFAIVILSKGSALFPVSY